MPRKRVEARAVKHNGKRQWRVIVPKELNGGAQSRRYFEKSADAKAYAADMEAKRQAPHSMFFALASNVQNAVMHALDSLGEDSGLEIADAIKFYLAHQAKEKRALGLAVAECVEAKRVTGKRHRYIVALKNTLTRFSEGRENVMIHEIGAKEIERWINSPWPEAVEGKKDPVWHAPSVATRRSRQIDLGTLFSYAVKRGYCQRNPIDALEKHSYDDKTPLILTVSECEAVMSAAGELYGGDLLATVALMLFGGLRPYEAYKMKWDDIREGGIVLDASKTKTRDRRTLELNATLKTWLDHAKAKGSRLPAYDGPRRMTAARKAVRPWPQDCMRHSFVSYGMEIYGWEWSVKQAGHSLAMAFDHYRAIVTRTEAEKFWAIRPVAQLPEFTK